MRNRWWWIAGAMLVVIAAIVGSVGPESQFAEVSFVFALLWALASLCLVSWRIWRWMTYRVGVRLFITYFLIGVLPLLFAAAFGGFGLYVLMGQYTSVRIGTELQRVGWGLSRACETILEAVAREGLESAMNRFEDIAADPPPPISRVLWNVRIGEQEQTLADGFSLPEMNWLPEGVSQFTALGGNTAFVVTAARSPSGDRVVALIPLDGVTAADISAQWWFDVAFFNSEDAHIEVSGGGGDEEDESSPQVASEGVINFAIDGDEVSAAEIWPKWTEGDQGLLSLPSVFWFRVVVDMVDLETGDTVENKSQLALLRTSPRNVWDDFTLSRYELNSELLGVLAGLGALFLVGYGLALTGAATVVLSIARSTSRLTQGARQVELGNLDYRVPVKRKDQLGDLAATFNHMTDSVQSMLADVAEKERLSQELELAREIQESLLPARHLEVGPVSIRATFQPAAEVGGDYFDVFSMSETRLVIAIGDVAGHGLSTGLLMASLKSSVAALVHEGYGGPDLIDKANHLLMEHGKGRSLVTLTVVEIDLEEGRLTLTNAGHCPALLLHTEGEPEELMASAMPMGSRLCKPASLERPFPVSSRLVLYSDGLVEALSPDGEPFGYDHLEEILSGAGGRSGADVTAMILDALAQHADGVPAADDMTILVVERV